MFLVETWSLFFGTYNSTLKFWCCLVPQIILLLFVKLLPKKQWRYLRLRCSSQDIIGKYYQKKLNSSATKKTKKNAIKNSILHFLFKKTWICHFILTIFNIPISLYILRMVGAILRNYKGDMLFMFSKHVGVKGSN